MLYKDTTCDDRSSLAISACFSNGTLSEGKLKKYSKRKTNPIYKHLIRDSSYTALGKGVYTVT